MVGVEAGTLRRRVEARLAPALEALDLAEIAPGERCQRPRVAVRPGCGRHVDAELEQLGGRVVQHPLLEDLVLGDDAVGDHPAVDLAAGRRPPSPGAGVVADVEGPVRRDEALLVVAGPDHLVGVVAHVGEGADPLDRAGDHLFDAVPRASVVVHPARRRVGVVDVADVLVFPDPMGDAHDVVDDVDVGVLEPAHRLAARAAVGHRTVGTAPDLQGDREVGRHDALRRPARLLVRTTRGSGGGARRRRPLTVRRRRRHCRGPRAVQAGSLGHQLQSSL